MGSGDNVSMALFQAVNLLGHESHEWDPQVPGDLKKIKKFFEEKLKAGFRAFAFTPDGETRQIHEFDEDAERVVLTAEKVKMLPPIRGG